ncbi:MAG: 50S ribosomal protein L15 [Patescibacteria group bacterium]
MTLHNLSPSKGKKSKKRIGRGLGSTGRTSGRGQKGQKARAGASGFQRLGMRKLMLATPKLRGFRSQNEKNAIVNLSDLAKAFKKGEVVTPKALMTKKLISTAKNGVKILGVGEIAEALQIQGCAVSKTAAEKIIKVGGNIQAQ